MDTLTIFIIAFSLAMDAVAVSVSNGISIQHKRTNHAIRIGLSFGLFQAFMPILGWGFGLIVKEFISGIDHWLAFGLLGLIGFKMIYESTKIERERKKVLYLKLWVLLVLSLATSIDAMVVGIGFALLNISIATPVIIIGGVTSMLSFFGFFLGNKIGYYFGKRIEFLGGVILIAIGVKILIDHI